MLVGYARVSTDAQDLLAQREGLARLGVDAGAVYVDHGMTGTNRARPGLTQALAACSAGDTLVVTKLERLARSLFDARDIAEELSAREVGLSIGGFVQDPRDPLGRFFFSTLALLAEFESDLARMRTREGMQIAKAKGRLRGKKPKLKPADEAALVQMKLAGRHTDAEIAEIFGVSRSTLHRAMQRAFKPPGDAAASLTQDQTPLKEGPP